MSRLASCMEAAAISAWLCVWIQKLRFFQATSGWFIYPVPESMRACLRAAHSSMRSFGMPSATALAMPPISSMSLMNYTKKKTQVWTEWLHDERLQHYCIYLCGWRLPHKNCTRHQGCKKVCICSSISSLSWLNCGWIINSSLKQYSDYFLDGSPVCCLSVLLTNLQSCVIDVIRESLHHVRAPPGIGYFRDARLLLDDDLGVPGNASAFHRGQTQSFIEGVGVEGLGPPKHSCHALNHRTDHIVVGILRRVG